MKEREHRPSFTHGHRHTHTQTSKLEPAGLQALVPRSWSIYTLSEICNMVTICDDMSELVAPHQLVKAKNDQWAVYENIRVALYLMGPRFILLLTENLTDYSLLFGI